jgi:hypothetical protein
MFGFGFWIGVLIGALLIGVPAGLLIQALCTMAKESEEGAE